MFLYDVVDVSDMGSHYQINFLTQSDLTYIQPGRCYHKVSHVAANMIRDSLSKGDQIIFPKGLAHEVIPGDLHINIIDDLTKHKSKAIAEINCLVDSYLVTASMLDFYNFIVLNNVFVNKGIVITDANREEKYLEVINTGDETLISNLEEYLEAKDKISQINNMYIKLKKFRQEVLELTTIEEVENLTNQYISAIKNP